MAIDELIQTGISAAKAGDRVRALELLEQAVEQDPHSAEAWLWLGRCLTDPARRADCFSKVLEIDPANPDAMQELIESMVPPGLPAETAPGLRAAAPASASAKKPQPGGLSYYALGIIVFLFLAALMVVSTFGGMTGKGISGLQPTPTFLPNYYDRLWDAYVYTDEATRLMNQGKCDQAAVSWEKVLEIAPDYAEARYFHAKCLKWVSGNDNYYWSHMETLDLARDEVDRAILQDPTKGRAFLLRSRIYESYAGSSENRVDQIYYRDLALQNMRAANRLGSGDEFSHREVPLILFYMGKCKEGMEEIELIRKYEGLSAPPSAAMMNIEAHGYLCLGQFDKALEAVDQGLAIQEHPERKWLKSIILYNMGRSDDSLDTLNEALSEDPEYGGVRYYHRALLHYDAGRVEQAMEDVEIGSGNTWGRGGVRAYLLGRFALEAGDRELAIEYFRESLNTLNELFYGRTLKPRIQRELLSLLALPKSARLDVTIQPTAMPMSLTRPLDVQVHVEKNENGFPLPPYPVTVISQKGTGEVRFRDMFYPVYLFTSSVPVAVESVQKLSINLRAPSKNSPHPFLVFIWDQTTGQWHRIDPKWGANPVEDPARYISKAGEIYVAVRYDDNEEGTIANIWPTLYFKNADGKALFIDLKSK